MIENEDFGLILADLRDTNPIDVPAKVREYLAGNFSDLISNGGQFATLVHTARMTMGGKHRDTEGEANRCAVVAAITAFHRDFNRGLSFIGGDFMLCFSSELSGSYETRDLLMAIGEEFDARILAARRNFAVVRRGTRIRRLKAAGTDQS